MIFGYQIKIIIFIHLYMLFKYIAGNRICHVLNKSKHILKNGRIPVINYAIESNNNKLLVFKEYEKLCNKLDSNYRIAIKLSSLNFDKNLIDDIIQMYKSKNIKILIDAEDNKSNNLYQNRVNSLLLEYNNDKCNIFKTYQMYRKDAIDNLRKDIYFCKKNNIFLGVKMVRGAYWYSEKNNGHLFIKKEETDISYNKGIMELYENRSNKIIPILATHNDESINLGLLLNEEKQYFEFGHLLGMKQNKYNRVYGTINVYVPYGPYNKMIPYLGRRLFENIDTVKYIFI